MNYNKIFKGKMSGPYTFFYKGDKNGRVCYIINGYCSGLYNVYCPAYYDEGATFTAEYNLAKANHDQTIFKQYGNGNYLN